MNTKKQTVQRPSFSTSSFVCNESLLEDDTKTPPSLICSSPTYQKGVPPNKPRAILGNITKESSNEFNRRVQPNHSSQSCKESFSQTTSTTNREHSANGKTNAAVNHSRTNSNTSLNISTQNCFPQQQDHNQSSNPISSPQDEPTLDSPVSEETSAVFDEFHMEDDEEMQDEYEEEYCNFSQDELIQPNISNTYNTRAFDPDMFSDQDKRKIQHWMDQNIKNPMNLLPKNGPNFAHLPVDVEEDILQYLFLQQHSKQPEAATWASVQQIVNPNMRTMLVEWIIGVSVSFKLLPETLYLSINILDRFLCSVQITNTRLLQGYGLTSLFIASKIHETNPPPLKQLLFAADNTYTRATILNLESEICNVLDFEFCSIQSFDFIEKFLEITGHHNDLYVKHLAYYICEMQLQNFDSLYFKRSIVALSSVIVALYLTNNQYATLQIAQIICSSYHSNLTQHIVQDVNTCLSIIFGYFYNMCSNEISHNFVKDKYSRDSFGKVSMVTIPAHTNPPQLFI